MIKRGKDPFAGKWALPGGFVDQNEDLNDAALRELKEVRRRHEHPPSFVVLVLLMWLCGFTFGQETHLEVPQIKQVGAFGKPGRDPRGHTISVAYYTVVDHKVSAVYWYVLGSVGLMD